MAKTLLNATNEVLKKVRIINGDSGVLATLTDSPRQTYIDVAIQAWNEVVEQLYSESDLPFPQELAEATITLATDTREYALADDLVQLRFPLLDETNGQYIIKYPGGYIDMVMSQSYPGNYTGLPTNCAIRETDGKLYVDRSPTSEFNGRIYKYRYDKDISLSAAADAVPFSDAVFRAVVPAVAEIWKRDQRSEFDAGIYKASMGRASRLLTKKQMKRSWLPIRSTTNYTDPLNG